MKDQRAALIYMEVIADRDDPVIARDWSQKAHPDDVGKPERDSLESPAQTEARGWSGFSRRLRSSISFPGNCLRRVVPGM